MVKAVLIVNDIVNVDVRDTVREGELLKRTRIVIYSMNQNGFLQYYYVT